MLEPLKRVVTESGQVYGLGDEIGSGLQGKVYAVPGQPRAVKVLFDNSPQELNRLREQISFVQGRPLEGLRIARPLELLRAPLAGYVMELLTEMSPLDAVMRPPSDGDRMAWYIATGGLRRRLRILGRCADTFAQLHGIPLVYMDLSSRNVLVSCHVESDEVWLIDTDNLSCISSTISGFYTPRYVAPEVYRRFTDPTSLADAYSFAVIAFETLAQVHPFEGCLVADLPPAHVDSLINRGEAPWIDDPDDRRNEGTGLDRKAILTQTLQGAFQRIFGPGLRNPTARPGMAEWAGLLHDAADLTVRCPGCEGTYYPKEKACPWCGDPRPAFVLVNFRRWEPEADPDWREKWLQGKESQVARCVVTFGETIELTERHTRAATGAASNGRCLELSLGARGLEVRVVDGRAYHLTETATGSHPRLRAGRTIPAVTEEGMVLLHFGQLSEPHRLATFAFYPEVRG